MAALANARSNAGAIAALNLMILVGIVRVFRDTKPGPFSEPELGQRASVAQDVR
jgi:hypothetical protein